MRAPALRGYYAILDLADAPDAEPSSVRARAEALLAATPCALQLRAKTLTAAQICAAARSILPLCRSAGVPLCVNDRVDLALAVGADMVHVGQDDLSITDVQRILSKIPVAPSRPDDAPRLVIGVSTHNLPQAQAAIAAGADYIGFGPVFATTTKRNPDPTVGLQTLAQLCALSPIPVVAIGGISRANVARVVAAGAHAVAVISDIDRASDRSAAARAVAAAFPSALLSSALSTLSSPSPDAPAVHV